MSEALDILQLINKVSGEVMTYRITTQWYDGTPLTDTLCDGVIYRKLGGVYYKKQIDPKTILKIQNIAELRNTNGYYEGQEVTLLGYYVSGDKLPVTYKFTTLVNTPDNGGSIIASSRGRWVAQFKGVCDVKDFGAIKNTESTSIINLALQLVDDVTISEDYIVNPDGKDGNQFSGGVKPRTNNILRFVNGAKLTTLEVLNNFYSLLTLSRVNNVKIYDPHVVGDLLLHTGTTGEWGHGITVYGCEDIEIHNFTAEYCWGDGFAIGSYVRGTDIHPNKRVNLFGDNVTNYCRRNGTSIISCDGLYIENISASYNGTIRGTNPRYGVDIEPNNGGNDIINVTIDRCYTYGNSEGGLEIIPAYMQDIRYINPGIFKCKIGTYITDNDGVTTENRGSLRIAGADNTIPNIIETKQIDGYIEIDNIICYNSVKKAITITRHAATGLNIKFGNVSIINPWTSDVVTNQRAEKNAIHFQTQPTQLTYGNVTIDNLYINAYRGNLIVGVYLQSVNETDNLYKNIVINSYEHLGGWTDPVETPTYGPSDETVLVKMAKPVVLNLTGSVTMSNYAVVNEMTIIVKTPNSFLTLPNTTIVKNKKIKIVPEIATNTIYSVQGRNESQPIDIQPRTNRILNMVSGSSVTIKATEGLWKILDYSGDIYNVGFPTKGTTAQRPTGLLAENTGFSFFDTTVGYKVFWSGTGWSSNITSSYSNITSNTFDMVITDKIKTWEITPSADCTITLKPTTDNLTGAVVFLRNNVNFNITLKADTGVTIMGSTTFNQVVMSKRAESIMLVCNGLNQWRYIILNYISNAVADAVTTTSPTVSLANLVPITTADATDAAQTMALVNEIKALINLDVALTNDIKSKYNTSSPVINSTKNQLNAKLAADRLSQQQAP